MYLPGNDFFAGAGLPGDQDGCHRWRNLLDEPPHLLRVLAYADESPLLT
jgi:hypothetical protein